MIRSVPKVIAFVLLEGLFVLALLAVHAKADPPLFGIGTQTLGGRFVWTDEVIYSDWRVQRHSVVGHHRLICPQDRRHAVGSFDHCLEKLEELKTTKAIPPLPKEVVIVAHGLGASRQMMNGLANFLEEEGGFYVVNFGYASTNGEISEHAQSLASVIRHLEGVEQVNFVAHSMGNIVVRHCLSDMAQLPVSEQPEITYDRMVMIAPPNHGADVADNFADRKIAQIFAGDALQELAPEKGWNVLEKRLATPSFEFGIIAGGRGDGEGYLAAIPGDDDGLLTLETTRLEGASDFVQVKSLHQLMPLNKQVREYTLRFLQQGHFLPSGRKYPIVATDDLTQSQR